VRLTWSEVALISERLQSYIYLVRLDKPIGILLLLWPTLWGLWIASDGFPNPIILLIFCLGTVFMRSAGCAINDYADRHFDKHVERTQHPTNEWQNFKAGGDCNRLNSGAAVIWINSAFKRIDQTAFGSCRSFGCHLSLYETLFLDSTSNPWFSIWFWYSHGICSSTKSNTTRGLGFIHR